MRNPRFKKLGMGVGLVVGAAVLGIVAIGWAIRKSRALELESVPVAENRALATADDRLPTRQEFQLLLQITNAGWPRLPKLQFGTDDNGVTVKLPHNKYGLIEFRRGPQLGTFVVASCAGRVLPNEALQPDIPYEDFCAIMDAA